MGEWDERAEVTLLKNTTSESTPVLPVSALLDRQTRLQWGSRGAGSEISDNKGRSGLLDLPMRPWKSGH